MHGGNLTCPNKEDRILEKSLNHKSSNLSFVTE
jgi:hypothetical protein